MTACHPHGQPQKHIEAPDDWPNPRRAPKDVLAAQTAGGGGGSETSVRCVVA